MALITPCPITEDIKLSDYVLEFPHELSLETNTILGSELLSFKKRKIPSDGKLLSLSENLFDNDFLIFPDLNCEWVRLRKKDEAKGTKVHFKDYPHLALWSKPGADFLCIEPWLGLPDFEDESTLLTQKRAHQIIQPNETFSIDIVTEVEDIS